MAKGMARLLYVGLTGIFDLMVGVAEDFEGTAKLLSAKGGVESDEDLNHRNRSICAVFYCTHLDLCSVIPQWLSISIAYIVQAFASCFESFL